MLFSKAAVLATVAAAFTSMVQAQGETPDGNVKVHVVQVGDKEGNLRFYPEELVAEKGEMVQFHFWPVNHSVAQSSFADPCQPLEETVNTTAGFFSGFMPVKKEDTFMPTFTIMVNQTTPIWFYCATGKHCQNGMVGVINAPKDNADRTLAKYREAAANSNTVVPGPPSGGEVDPDAPKPPTGGNDTTPGGNDTTTPPTTTPPASVTPGSAASSIAASTFTVLLGAVAAAFFLA